MSMQIAKTLTAATLLALASAVATPATARQAAAPNAQLVSSANVLSLAELEKRASVQVPDIREMEVEGLLLKVEGYDTQGRKVKLVVDRRNGSVLSHRVKPSKHSLQRASEH